MKKFALVFVILFISGCASVPIEHAHGHVTQVVPVTEPYEGGYSIYFEKRHYPLQCNQVYGLVPKPGDDVQAFQAVAFGDFLGCYFQINND